MADTKQSLRLCSLPLEVRHKIFEYVTIRPTKPKKLLRYWFEKEEASEAVAKYVAANPGCLTPIIVHPGPMYPADVEEDLGDESGYDGESGEDGEEDDSGEDDDGEEDGEEYGEESDIGEIDDEYELIEGGTEDFAMTDDVVGSSVSTTATKVPPPVLEFKPQTKWRYIPNFMRVTHCPPPVEMFLACKQLNEEVKSWFYDVLVLRIEATGSFAHTSFFEEAFEQITDADFSPVENIRKTEVTFVWDTTWIRTDPTGCVEAIFPALLRQRAEFVLKILRKAPNLKEVVVHWHDSAQDSESKGLMDDVLAGFLNLPANVKVKEHYISADAKPRPDSIAGKRRREFRKIEKMGIDSMN